MNNGAKGGDFVAITRLNQRTAKRVGALKRLYFDLCAEGATGEVPSFFADNFHTVLSGAITRPTRGRSCGQVYFPGKFPLAEGIISASGNEFPSADEIIMILRRYSAARRIFGCELEYLRYSLSYTLIEKIYELSKTWDSGLIRMISLLADLSAVDEAQINSVLNPVAIRLADDPAYQISDPKTKLLYREAIYRTARRFDLDELKLCDDLFEKHSPEPIDIMALTVLKNSRVSEKSAVFAAVLLMIFAALLSLGIALWADAPLAALILFLPATEALRPVSDWLLLHIRRSPAPFTRLPRLCPDAEQVKSTTAAIVLSAAISDPEEAIVLHDKLFRLHCLNPAENISVCALIDLPAEQVPITSEDKPIIESLAETIERLNAEVGERFCCIVRRRTFSETQQEYMGEERKRGALYDLARFMKTGESDFYAALGAVERLRGADYICAVDSDTLPTMDSVSELLAIALHPANRVEVKNGFVTRGSGIIAPRMVTRLRDSLRSEFSKSMGGIGSVSSYDEEAGSLYQEVFGRGTFCGKGLINVTALYECTASLRGERILSHDILEGELLGTAYAGDVCFTEGFPKSPQSYYRRLDRWIRGDFQNLPEVFSKRFSALSKLKLLDNLRRAALPPIVFTAFLISFFTEPVTSTIIASAALILWIFPSVFGTVSAFIRGGRLGLRFYSGLLGTAAQGARYVIYNVIMLPTLALKSLRAIFTALTRLITRRRLLEWTTADASDRASRSPLTFYLLPELLSLALLRSPDYTIRLFGAVFALMPVVLAFGDSPSYPDEPSIKYRDIRELSRQTADMWGFYDSFVTVVDNYLPPDNVQFAPVYRIAHRTSPTNIGLYMLSVLAAYDRKIISQKSLIDRLDRTLSTVEQLEKYCGNLYNWYDTKTLDICPNPYVSSVDSGNFIACMVALKEGLEELEWDGGLIERIEKIISECDFSVFYDAVRGLMAIGIDPKTGSRGRSHYDYLMSEARLTSFWAIASRQVPKSHWQRLSRTMMSQGFHCGAASYSGTMFEFFMPELLLKSPEGSLFNESLRYALGVQKRYAESLDRPYGISESGFYSFDNALNYRYMAHGVPNTGVRRGLADSFVVSPYSTYISLCMADGEGVQNLRKIADYGMYGTYGLYEALDFTPPDSDKPEPVRSYMAHHVGMSILACDNILAAGIMQKRFMRDPRVMGALELLDERFHLGRLVFENNLRRPRLSAPEPRARELEVFEEFSPSAPHVKLLSNGELTLLISDNGDSTALYRSKNVYTRTRDPISRPKGIFSYFSDGGEGLAFSYLPNKSGNMTAEFSEDSASFYRTTERLSAGMRVWLHEEYPCELRTFALKNETAKPLDAAVFSYIEPSLLDDGAEIAHPAYNKLFLRCERDPRLQISVITRVREEQKIFLAVGFIEDVKETVSFDRGEVGGIEGLEGRFAAIPPSLICEPDPCVFVRTSLELPPRAEAEITMFLLCADSRDELINRVCALRRKRLKPCSSPRLDTAYGRVASLLLPAILYDSPTPKPEKVPENLPLQALWELSVSIDLPIVFIALNDRNDREKLSAYLGAYRLLRRCGVGLQLIFAFDDGGRYERSHYTELIAEARRMGLEGSVYSSGGILPLDLSKVRRELYELAAAAACHVCIDEIATADCKPEPSAVEYAEILCSKPTPQLVSQSVACGGFAGEAYVINEQPPLPWCHVLSNPVFGTLLSHQSLGFTYAFNSRENRLTPWDNDPERDNLGERLLLKINGKIYDLVRGAAAVFSPYKAEYFSESEEFKAQITVSVSSKGMCKRVDVKLDLNSRGQLCYYAEPCLGVTRGQTRLITPKRFDKGLTLTSAASQIGGYMCLSASKSCSASTDRDGILSGRWAEEVAQNSGLIAAVFCEVEGSANASFYLSYGLTERSAMAMPSLFAEQTDTREQAQSVNTGDRKTDILTNCWLRYQALHGRIFARTGFWQCSGAYGFRDQLQDAVGISAENPHILKTQILRCCRAQFPQGDVMHWWHSLPNRKWRGIRTRISDDGLWLPYALCEYIERTGDLGILHLAVAYSDGITLAENENERYGEVYKTAHRESVYLHCRRAIDFRAGKTGEHGLMLIGIGDWNDGFNAVGKDGKGESVWLSEFYIIVLRRFARIAEMMGDPTYSQTLLDYADALAEAVEEAGRGALWYLRGYFDDGRLMGSEKNAECKIDSLSQSFAQFAGLGGDGFAKSALENAVIELCDFKRGVIKLFTPAFSDDAEPDPGYVRCYPDGIRENGGQYTHGAVWLGMACLRAGLSRQGREILAALSPIKHAENGIERYKTEPYYLCGDVYANQNCFGRGGWSIYTGSAAWYYRALREAYGENN